MPDDKPRFDPEMIALVRKVNETVYKMLPEGVGYALMVFDFDDDGLYFTSNGDKDGVINALREIVRQNTLH